MNRRQTIGLLGSAAVWPLAARGQAAMPVVGFLSSRAPDESALDLAGFRRGLAQAGYVEGQNVLIDYRWAENHYDRLPEMASDLVRSGVTVIAALGGPITALAVKAVTTTIPFIFISGVDPVKLGLVDSFNRPSGNATGVNMFITAVESKRLGLLHELTPSADLIGVLVNPNSPELDTQLNDMQVAARTIGCELHIVRVGTNRGLTDAFARLAETTVRALLVAADPFFNSERETIVALAAHYRIPAIYESRGYATAGGLISYGPNLSDMYRQVGLYTGQILKGSKPAQLPVIQPTALELIINVKTAKTLGLEIPPQLLARADEVIE
jgi:putative ABC transport system substrate-binding protein